MFHFCILHSYALLMVLGFHFLKGSGRKLKCTWLTNAPLSGTVQLLRGVGWLEGLPREILKMWMSKDAFWCIFGAQNPIFSRWKSTSIAFHFHRLSKQLNANLFAKLVFDSLFSHKVASLDRTLIIYLDQPVFYRRQIDVTHYT